MTRNVPLEGQSGVVAEYLEATMMAIIEMAIIDRMDQRGVQLDALLGSAAVTVIAHVLIAAKADPEIGEWLRYQLCASLTAEEQANISKATCVSLRKLREGLEAMA